MAVPSGDTAFKAPLWRSLVQSGEGRGDWGQLKGEEGSPQDLTSQAQAPRPSERAARKHSDTPPCKLQTGRPHGGPRGPHPAVASGPWTTALSPVALGLSASCIVKAIVPLHCAATAPQPGNVLRLKRPGERKPAGHREAGACRESDPHVSLPAASQRRVPQREPFQCRARGHSLGRFMKCETLPWRTARGWHSGSRACPARGCTPQHSPGSPSPHSCLLF